MARPPTRPADGAPDGAAVSALSRIVEDQQRQIAALTSAVRELNQKRARSAHGFRYKGTNVGYRYDPGPKWIHASGLPEALGGLYPVLWYIIERERHPGEPVKATYAQVAAVCGIHRETARKRIRELAARGFVAVLHGNGNRPTVVSIEHPINTPLAYDEVPWSAGGLGAAPDGVLESLSGADREYALLYGVELPAPGPMPVQGGSTHDTQRERPSGEGIEDCGGQNLPLPRGEDLPPLDTGDVPVGDKSDRSHARTNKGIARTERTDRQNTPAQRMEREAAEIPPSEVGDEAIADAREACEAMRREDEITAHRAAQIAELLRRQDRASQLREALRRIRRAVEGGTRIDRPGVYLCTAILDVVRTTPDASGTTLAGRVLAKPRSGTVREDTSELLPLPAPDQDAQRALAVLLDAIAEHEGCPRDNYFRGFVPAGVENGNLMLVCQNSEYPGYIRERFRAVLDAHLVQLMCVAEYRQRGAPGQASP